VRSSLSDGQRQEIEMLNLESTTASEQLSALNAFVTLTRHPADFTAIYDLDAVLRQTSLADLSMEHLKTQPGMADMIRDRYLGPIPDLDTLIKLPTESLGYQYASHLMTSGFDPIFYRQISVEDDISYIALRRSQTHDIHHMITGFGTDLPSELGLQAFELAQMRSPLAISLLGSGIVYTLSQPSDLEHTMHLIHQGWEMGLQAKSLMAQRWEEHWERPIPALRKALNVEAILQS
jgi:ubiquinone biosynthesis protein COQ4